MIGGHIGISSALLNAALSSRDPDRDTAIIELAETLGCDPRNVLPNEAIFVNKAMQSLVKATGLGPVIPPKPPRRDGWLMAYSQLKVSARATSTIHISATLKN